MVGYRAIARLAPLALLAPCGAAAAADADYVVGNRYFAPTTITDDPFVADSAYATVSRMRTGTLPNTDDTAAILAVSGRITDRLGLEIEDGYHVVGQAGAANAYGFDNLAVILKYQFVVSDAHELVLSGGVERGFGGTGSDAIGADRVGATAPTFYFGKGMGDLPDGLAYLRPLAVTGLVAYEISDRRGTARPDTLSPGLSLQYNLRYLEGNVRYLGLPEFVDRLTPIVEAAFDTPATRAPGGTTTGTVAAGLVYVGNSFDVAVEATWPATRASGKGMGFATLLRLRLDRLFHGPLLAGIGQRQEAMR